MFEGPLGDVGDPLDIPMGMHRPRRSRHEAVIVEDAQIAKPGVLRVLVIVEAEVPVGAEPAAFDMVERLPRTEDDHFLSLPD